MAHSKRGYLAIGKETTAGTVVKPSVYVKMISESMTTNKPVVFSDVVYGSRSKRLHVNRGANEAPAGEIVIEAEANTIGYFLEGVFGAPSTSGPTDTTAYTHVFTQPYVTTALSTYTMDIAIGDNDSVKRYYGCKFYGISMSQEGNVIRATIKVMAMGEFITTRFAGAEATGQTSLSVFQTKGIHADDTLNLGLGTVGEEEKAVTSITNPTTVVTAATGADHALNDLISIKRSSPSFSEINRFIWIGSQNEGGTAKIAAAIGSVALENFENFTFTLDNEIEARNAATGVNNEDRYPSALLDKGYEGSGTLSRYWTDLDEQDKYDFSAQRAVEIEFVGGLAGATTTRSNMKIQLPDVRLTKQPLGNLGADDIIEEELEFVTAYDESAGYEAKVTLINQIASY